MVDSFENYYKNYLNWKYMASLVYARVNQAVERATDRGYNHECRGFVNYLLGGPDRQQGGVRLQLKSVESNQSSPRNSEGKPFAHQRPLVADRRA